MVNVSVTMEWPDPGEVGANWIKNSYYSFCEAQVLRWIKILDLITGHNRQPDPANWNLRIELKFTGWQNYQGTWCSGEFIMGSLDQPDKILVEWPREMNPGDNLYHKILNHEILHMYLYRIYDDFVSWPDNYLNSGHGGSELDIIVKALRKLIREIYPENHSSWPSGILP